MGDKKKETREFFQQAFWLFYGVFIGFIAGIMGGTWGTLYFEYVIKRDTSLAYWFLDFSLALVALYVILGIGTMVCYKKAKE
jgi:hypothetical protein